MDFSTSISAFLHSPPRLHNSPSRNTISEKNVDKASMTCDRSTIRVTHRGRQHGFMEILIAVGIVSVLAVISLTTSFSSQVEMKRKLERLNHVEAFYTGEMFAWHAYQRSADKLSIGEVTFENSPYTNLDITADTYSAEPGSPLNIATTLKYAASQTLIRRYNPQKTVASVPTAGAYCGKTGFTSKKSYQTCLRTTASASTGRFYVTQINGDTVISRYLANGALDTSYGVNGSVTLTEMTFNSFVPIKERNDRNVLLMLSKGPTLFNSRGELVTSFGSGGHVTLTYFSSSVSELVSSVTFNAQDSFMYPFPIIDPTTLVKSKLALQLVRSNGIIDPKFGDQGTQVIDFFNDQAYSERADWVSYFNDVIYLLAERVDSGNFGTGAYSMVRLHLNGQPDTSFGQAGFFHFTAEEKPSSLWVGPAGDVSWYGARTNEGIVTNVLGHILATGTIDLTYGTNGIVTPDQSILTAVTTQSAFDREGRLLLARMNVSPLKNTASVIRLKQTGELDQTFGVGGVALLVDETSVFGSYPNRIKSLLLAFDRDIYPVLDATTMQGKKARIFHLSPNGILDSQFGTIGELKLDLGTMTTSVYSIAIIR